MSADIVEFNVKCTMRADWAATFISMLKRMQYLGAIGSSRYMAFYADGDGTFRPKFDFDVDVPDVAIIGGALIPFCKCGVILKNKVAFCHKCSQRLIWTAGEKN